MYIVTCIIQTELGYFLFGKSIYVFLINVEHTVVKKDLVLKFDIYIG